MTHMQFRAEFEAGRSLEFVPASVEPLGLPELWRTLKEEIPTYDMKFVARNAYVDGAMQAGTATINAKMNFHEVPSPFALVQGGWLPMPLVIPQQFLVDKNVVAHLRTLNSGIPSEKLKSFKWWMKFFEEGSATFNPLPFAWEGGLRKTPSFAEFVTAFQEGTTEIREAIPKCTIATFGQSEYRAAYQMILDFESRTTKESRFLMSVSPMLFERVNRKNQEKILNAIIFEAKACDIAPMSIVVVAALSCLYDDVHGNIFSIGRKLLKPKPAYDSRAAFNALADLRHIEIAAAGQIYFGKQGFALSTCDIALASLWCALSPTGTFSAEHEIEFTFNLSQELFPRLNHNEIQQLHDRLAN